MSASAILEQGRQNAISSFNLWLATNLPGAPFDTDGNATVPLPDLGLPDGPVAFSLQFDRPLVVGRLQAGPVLCVTDRGLFAPTPFDVNDRVATSGAEEVYGQPQQSYLEFVVWGDSQVRRDERARLMRIRDAVLSAFRMAGRRDSTDTYIVPPMLIYDFSGDVTNPTPTNNYLRRNRDSNWLVETDLDDPKYPNVVGWRGLLKIEWTEFFQ